jgi:hypothetical protein
LYPRIRSFHVPSATWPVPRARSKTLGIETLDARTVPLGSTRCRSTSLWISKRKKRNWKAHSGHQRAPSNVIAFRDDP